MLPQKVTGIVLSSSNIGESEEYTDLLNQLDNIKC